MNPVFAPLNIVRSLSTCRSAHGLSGQPPRPIRTHYLTPLSSGRRSTRVGESSSPTSELGLRREVEHGTPAAPGACSISSRRMSFSAAMTPTPTCGAYDEAPVKRRARGPPAAGSIRERMRCPRRAIVETAVRMPSAPPICCGLRVEWTGASPASTGRETSGQASDRDRIRTNPRPTSPYQEAGMHVADIRSVDVDLRELHWPPVSATIPLNEHSLHAGRGSRICAQNPDRGSRSRRLRFDATPGLLGESPSPAACYQRHSRNSENLPARGSPADVWRLRSFFVRGSPKRISGSACLVAPTSRRGHSGKPPPR